MLTVAIFDLESERIKALVEKLELGKVELDKWAEVQAKKFQDEDVLEKYSKEDSAKIKHLTMKLQQNRDVLQKTGHRLEQILTDTSTAQVELTRVGLELKKALQDRHDLVKHWENAVREVRKRDEKISDSQVALDRMHDRVIEINDIFEETQQKLNASECNKLKITKAISADERTNAITHNKIFALKTSLGRLEADSEVLSTTLRNCMLSFAIFC